MVEKIKITCTRCRSRFSHKVVQVREGQQAQCPSCGCFVNFTAESMDTNIRRAMTEARRIRNSAFLSDLARSSD